MSADPYSERVRTLFASPAHAGSCASGAHASVDDQGVRIELSAVASNGVIEQLRFRAMACPHVLAASEAFCAEYEGRAARELQDFSASELMQSLAVPVEKSGRILVLEDAVRMLGAAIRETSQSTEQN